MKYTVTAEITITIYASVTAESVEAAKDAALQLALPDINSCSPDDDDYWQVDGLDGEPQIVEVEDDSGDDGD